MVSGYQLCRVGGGRDFSYQTHKDWYVKITKLQEIYRDRSFQNLNLSIKAGSDGDVLIGVTKLMLIQEIVL